MRKHGTHAPIVGLLSFSRCRETHTSPCHVKQARDSPWRERSSVKGTQDNTCHPPDTMAHHSISLNTVELGPEQQHQNDACRGIVWRLSDLYLVVPGVELIQDNDNLNHPLPQTLQLASSDKDEFDFETRIESRSGWLCIHASATLQCSQRTSKRRQDNTLSASAANCRGAREADALPEELSPDNAYFEAVS